MPIVRRWSVPCWGTCRIPRSNRDSVPLENLGPMRVLRAESSEVRSEVRRWGMRPTGLRTFDKAGPWGAGHAKEASTDGYCIRLQMIAGPYLESGYWRKLCPLESAVRVR